LSTISDAASFDCAKASTNIEKSICSNPELSKLDNELSAAYKQEIQKSNLKYDLKTQQREWLKNKINKCTNESCIADAYTSRTAELSKQTSSTIKNSDSTIVNSKNNFQSNRSSTNNNMSSTSVSSNILENMIEGIEYIYYHDGSCMSGKGNQCVSFINYEQLCSAAVGATEGAVTSKAADSNLQDKTLLKGGNINKIDVHWAQSNEGDFKCYVVIDVSGMVNGNSTKSRVSGVATHFIKNKKEKILVSLFF
jgi:uncharacterized protein